MRLFSIHIVVVVLVKFNLRWERSCCNV